VKTESPITPGLAARRRLPGSAVAALVVVGLLWAVAAASPLFFERAAKIRLEERLRPPAANHPFGTDDLGRDLFARVIVATPISLTIGLTAAAVSLCVGFAVGGIAGYFGGAIDLALSRLIEVFLCFPVLFLLMALAAFLPPTPVAVVLAIGLTTWPGDARYARAEVLKVKDLDSTRAARAAGASTPRILVRHLLPSVLPPLLVSAAFGVAWAILAEAALSFLGIGIPPEIPSWGNIMAEGRTLFRVFPHNIFYPGIFLAFTVLAINIMGDGLRDTLDPKMSKKV